jgi:hypothetical protein|tara:strand:+ start:792 stop:1316 length:525 start_codon:yes stop_codon:yes gene_type:complete
LIPPFKELLDIGNSKKTALLIADTVVAQPNRMVELMDLFFDEDLRTCQRAAWPVGLLADKNPKLIEPYIKRMLDNLDSPHHDAVIRNTFRTFQETDFPEELEGIAFDKAFDFLLNINNAIAIRVFAMTVCGNIAIKYPELCHELIPVIEDWLPHGSAGFRSRGNSVLKKLRKVV